MGQHLNTYRLYVQWTSSIVLVKWIKRKMWRHNVYILRKSIITGNVPLFSTPRVFWQQACFWCGWGFIVDPDGSIVQQEACFETGWVGEVQKKISMYRTGRTPNESWLWVSTWLWGKAIWVTTRGFEGVPYATVDVTNTLVRGIYVFPISAKFLLQRNGVCLRVQVCMCLYVQANEGGAPGVMPLFCHYSKWKLCLSMEKGLAQRCMQSFQARPQCIPGISAIIHCRGEKRREQHKKSQDRSINCRGRLL